VTVCLEFCNRLWNHCYSNARFNSTPLSTFQLGYRNGEDFCQKQGFIVQRQSSSNCYNIHNSLVGVSGTTMANISGTFIISIASFVVYILMFF